MNTTLRTLNSASLTLDAKNRIFADIKRQYYNDDIDFDTLCAYNDLIFGTQTRAYGDVPAIAPIHVPSLCEEQGIEADVGDVGDLYARLLNLYKAGIIGDRELPHLFPITKQNAARIKAHETSLAADIGLAAVAEAL